MKNLILYLITFAALLLVDFIWIGGVAINYYRAELGTLLAQDFVWGAAILFYVFYTFALLVFVVKPALAANSIKKALVLGALFGFAAYMTYDLTNLATTNGWPLSITIVDMVWGTLLTASISVFTYSVGKRLKLG